MTEKIVIFGATSAIAIATARIWAAAGATLVLVGRDALKLEAVRADLVARSGTVASVFVSDLAVPAGHAALWADAKKALGGIVDVVLVAHGVLGDQAEGQRDCAAMKQVLDINFVTVAELLTPIANDFEIWKAGTIAVIGSVAGDRGRQSNYIYGAAKAGLAAFLSGLRNRLTPKGVNVLTIKPGFVDTPMTAQIKKGPLFATPAVVGQGIVAAIRQRKGEVYLPWFWRYIMIIIQHIPEMIFRKLRL